MLAVLLVIVIGCAKFLHARAQEAAQSQSGLQQIVDSWAAGHSFHSSVVVQEIQSGLHAASHNADTTAVTASTYKLFVAYTALYDVEQGTYTMDTRISTGQTVSDALNKMMVNSDNPSGKALGIFVGWAHVDSLVAAAGATHTNTNNYDSAGNLLRADKYTTAGDLAVILTKLQQGVLLNASDTSMLLGLMKNQTWRERIPAGVPSGIAVADKPGWLNVGEGDGENVQNDAAIVYGPKSTYVIVITTDSSGPQPLADLSRQVYGYLET